MVVAASPVVVVLVEVSTTSVVVVTTVLVLVKVDVEVQVGCGVGYLVEQKVRTAGTFERAAMLCKGVGHKQLLERMVGEGEQRKRQRAIAKEP